MPASQNRPLLALAGIAWIIVAICGILILIVLMLLLGVLWCVGVLVDSALRAVTGGRVGIPDEWIKPANVTAPAPSWLPKSIRMRVREH